VRSIPDPGFAGDDGSASPGLAAVLSAYSEDPADPARYSEVLAAIQHERLLVPVVATLGEVEYDEHGLAHDKTSDMATVLMRGRDGRLALLAFTSTAALHRWDPGARPVPAATRRVAAAARQDGASAVLVDVAGPVTFVLEEDDVDALADGFTLVDLAGRLAWAKAEQEQR
jgi:hypothetical protein